MRRGVQGKNLDIIARLQLFPIVFLLGLTWVFLKQRLQLLEVSKLFLIHLSYVQFGINLAFIVERFSHLLSSFIGFLLYWIIFFISSDLLCLLRCDLKFTQSQWLIRWVFNTTEEAWILELSLRSNPTECLSQINRLCDVEVISVIVENFVFF